MENLKLTVFDVFAYAFPGSIILLAIITLIEPSVDQIRDFQYIFSDIDISTGIAIVILSYIIGFIIDTPSMYLFQYTFRSSYGQKEPGEHVLTFSEKSVLARHLSPSNYQHIETWNVLSHMSRNLAASAIIFSIFITIHLFRIPKDFRVEWSILSLAVFISSIILLQRSHIFDMLKNRDLDSTIKSLHLEVKALKDALPENNNKIKRDDFTSKK